MHFQLALVHALNNDRLVQIPMEDFLGLQKIKDYPDHPTMARKRGIGQGPHQTDLGPPVYQGDPIAAQYTAQFTGSLHNLSVIAFTAPTKNRNTFHSVDFGLDHPIISKEVLSQLNFRKIVLPQKSFCLLPEELVDFQV